MEQQELFGTVLKIQEAYCVDLGIPLQRRFSDEELAPAREHLEVAKTVIDTFTPRGVV